MAKPIEVAIPAKDQNKIRILFVAHDAQLHGAQLTLLNVLRNLDRSRFSPFVVVPQTGPFNGEVVRMGIPISTGLVMRWVFRQNPVSLMSVFTAPWKLIRAPAIIGLFICGLPIRLSRLLLFIHLHHIDVIYTNTITIVDGAIAAKLSRKPHIWHLHENIDDTPGLLKVLPARYVAASLSLKLSTLVAVPSHALREKIFGHQLALPKVRIIHNGVDTRRFKPGAPTHFLHRQLGIPIDAPLVGICGVIQESKGHDIFIKVAAEVSKTFPNANYVLIGEVLPEYLSHLMRLARGLGLTGKLHFTGWRSDIPEIFRELQVLVIASKQEAFGLTAIESMAAGISVVSTRCGGPEEVVEDGETGFLVEVGDHSAIAQRVIELLTSDELRQFMGHSGRERAKQYFALESCIEKVERLIEQV